MTCGHSRYKPRTGRGKTLVAYKKLRYFPITPRLQRLFMSPRTTEHMTWHQSHHAVDGVMVHPSDGEAWKHFNSMHPHFSSESRNVHFGLCTDGFNPFGLLRGREHRDVVCRRRRLFIVPPDDEVLCVGKGLGFNHKIMINVLGVAT